MLVSWGLCNVAWTLKAAIPPAGMFHARGSGGASTPRFRVLPAGCPPWPLEQLPGVLDELESHGGGEDVLLLRPCSLPALACGVALFGGRALRHARAAR